jgi:ParB family transcriptional regulator, chromosome partitioning protein
LSARQALGKGLGALIPEKISPEAERRKGVQICGIEEIQPSRFQPRKKFDDANIQELADSIREKGIIQPLLVRRKDDKFELIAGERRWRAAQKAGVKDVPIVIKDVSDSEVIELSLIENIQRENLNAIEEAEAFKGLMEQFHITQEEISKRVGKDRTTITNTIRLLKLPQEIRQSLIDGKISMGHARAFLGLDGYDKQRLALKKVISGGLSVRQTESLVKRFQVNKANTHAAKTSMEWSNLVEELQRALGAKVRIIGKGKKGKIEIEFHSPDELDRLYNIMTR